MFFIHNRNFLDHDYPGSEIREKYLAEDEIALPRHEISIIGYKSL